MEDFLLIAGFMYILGILPAITVYLFVEWRDRSWVTFNSLFLAGVFSWITVLVFFLAEVRNFWDDYFGDNIAFDFTRRK